jgi:hypothetical protein
MAWRFVAIRDEKGPFFCRVSDATRRGENEQLLQQSPAGAELKLIATQGISAN